MKKIVTTCPAYNAYKKRRQKHQGRTFAKKPRFKSVSLFISTARSDVFKFNNSKICYLKPSVKEEGDSFAHFRYHKIKLPSSCFKETECKRRRRFQLKEVFLNPLVAYCLEDPTKSKKFFHGLLDRKKIFYPDLGPGGKEIGFKVQDEALFARYKGCHAVSNFDQFVDYFDFEKNFSIFSSLISNRIESLTSKKKKDPK
jgi:hypothetical protein